LDGARSEEQLSFTSSAIADEGGEWLAIEPVVSVAAIRLAAPRREP
jgi:hypothetical protein